MLDVDRGHLITVMLPANQHGVGLLASGKCCMYCTLCTIRLLVGFCNSESVFHRVLRFL